MAAIRSYTTVEQSHKLAEFLPIESADMWWLYITAQSKYIAMMHDEPDPHYLVRMESYGIKDAAIRCWSLAALLNYLRKIDFFPDIEADEYSVTMNINYYDEEEARPLAPVHNIKVEAESFIDACYKMILTLHELKLL